MAPLTLSMGSDPARQNLAHRWLGIREFYIFMNDLEPSQTHLVPFSGRPQLSGERRISAPSLPPDRPAIRAIPCRGF